MGASQLDLPGEQADGERLEGTVDRIVFESPDTGFLVARLRDTFGRERTIVGAGLPLSPGETVRLWGQWTDDPKFGRQFRVSRFQTILPSTVEGIERYLGSGLIHGIGPNYAERLVKAFGVDTLRVIDEEPQRLTEVEGIGKKRAARIREAWASQKAIQSIMVFLHGHGISTSQAVRIYKRYGDNAVTLLRQNPYQLAEDIPGVAFKTADAIAERLGVAKEDPKRLRAGKRYILDAARSEGHVYLPREELVERAVELLAVGRQRVEAALPTLESEGFARIDGDAIYGAAMWRAELTGAEGIQRIQEGAPRPVSIDVPRAIAWLEKTQGVELSPEQRQAVATAAEAKVMVITGGPGTGKTTIVNSLLAMFSKKGLTPALAAPTGRAAKRLADATGREAKTIHRLLEFSPAEGGFKRNRDRPLPVELLIVDEMSMVDAPLFADLMQATPAGARVILVGDVDQLPSVGPGNVLLDIIASGTAPVVRLETVFRQAAQSGIVMNAHRINRGQYPEFNREDFFFVERKAPEEAQKTLLEVATERLPKAYGLDPMRDIQVLAPMRRGEAGVTRLNEELQALLNPAGEATPRSGVRVGDKVMQLRNNYELEVYNGDVGRVALVDEETGEVQVAYDDRVALYESHQLDELALAYATTIHKAQGSEYPAVVMPLLPQHYMMLQRNIVYTGITRAKRLVVIIGDPRSLHRAIGNTDVVRRHTRLAERLRAGQRPWP